MEEGKSVEQIGNFTYNHGKYFNDYGITEYVLKNKIIIPLEYLIAFGTYNNYLFRPDLYEYVKSYPLHDELKDLLQNSVIQDIKRNQLENRCCNIFRKKDRITDSKDNVFILDDLINESFIIKSIENEVNLFDYIESAYGYNYFTFEQTKHIFNKIFKLMVKLNINIGFIFPNILFYIASYGSLEQFKLALSYGLVVKINILITASMVGNLAIVRFILENYPYNINYYIPNIYWTIYNKGTDNVKHYLLKKYKNKIDTRSPELIKLQENEIKTGKLLSRRGVPEDVYRQITEYLYGHKKKKLRKSKKK